MKKSEGKTAPVKLPVGRKIHSAVIPTEIIVRKIFIVRAKKVILDRELAELYGVETRVLNQAVKRNRKRFPEDFMLVLNRKEILRISQIVTSLKYSKNVLAFTEQGVAMLSSILNSERAIQVNIQIIRAFVKLREMILTHKDLIRKVDLLEKKFAEHDKKIGLIFQAIKQLLMPPKTPRRKMGF